MTRAADTAGRGRDVGDHILQDNQHGTRGDRVRVGGPTEREDCECILGLQGPIRMKPLFLCHEQLEEMVETGKRAYTQVVLMDRKIERHNLRQKVSPPQSSFLLVLVLP